MIIIVNKLRENFQLNSTVMRLNKYTDPSVNVRSHQLDCKLTTIIEHIAMVT